MPTGADQFEFFGYTPDGNLSRRYARDGCLSEESGTLVVQTGPDVAGSVHRGSSEYGPQAASRARRIGIALLPTHRGRGVGTSAQILLRDYLFSTSTVNRIEAGTDVENVAEQTALERAGFRREGTARGAQFRDGRWHDMAIYACIRSDHRAGL